MIGLQHRLVAELLQLVLVHVAAHLDFRLVRRRVGVDLREQAKQLRLAHLHQLAYTVWRVVRAAHNVVGVNLEPSLSIMQPI